MGDSSNLELISRYRELNNQNSNSTYVVRGGIAKCKCGSDSCVINLPYDSGNYINGDPMITVVDAGCENVDGFGICKVSNEQCHLVMSNWVGDETTDEQYVARTLSNESSVTTSFNAYCYTGGGEIRITSDGQSGNKNRNAPKNMELIKENDHVVGIAGFSEMGFEFHTSKEICGSFLITLWGESEQKKRYDKSDQIYTPSSDLMEVLPPIDVTVYKNANKSKMTYVGNYTLNCSGNYHTVIIDLKYDEKYCFVFDCDSENTIHFTIAGNVDCMNPSSFISWEIITDTSCFAYPHGFYNVNIDVYKKIFNLNKQLTTKLYNTLNFFEKAMQIDDEQTRKEKIYEICIEQIDEESDQLNNRIFDMIVNGTATALSEICTIKSAIVGFGFSMLTSYIGSVYSDLLEPQSLASKILEIGDIGGDFQAKNGIQILLGRNHIMLNGIPDTFEFCEIHKWSETEKIYYPRYYNGKVEFFSDSSEMMFGKLFEMSDVKFLLNYKGIF